MKKWLMKIPRARLKHFKRKKFKRRTDGNNTDEFAKECWSCLQRNMKHCSFASCIAERIGRHSRKNRLLLESSKEHRHFQLKLSGSRKQRMRGSGDFLFGQRLPCATRVVRCCPVRSKRIRSRISRGTSKPPLPNADSWQKCKCSHASRGLGRCRPLGKQSLPIQKPRFDHSGYGPS